MSKSIDSKTYKVVAQVEEEIHVALRILAIKKRLSLAEYVKDVLDKHVTSKSKVIETAEEV